MQIRVYELNNGRAGKPVLRFVSRRHDFCCTRPTLIRYVLDLLAVVAAASIDGFSGSGQLSTAGGGVNSGGVANF